MQADSTPIARDIVLVGGGHSHVVALRRFAMKPQPGVRLTLICTDTHTPYSGMLPGYIAGHYSYDEVHIDLRRLAQWAGARFYRDEVVGLDRAARTVICRDRPPVRYDVVSLNTGATPRLDAVAGAAAGGVAVKPIARFNERWLALLERVRGQHGTTRVAVVGAGAGGVEMALALQHRLHAELQGLGRSPTGLELHLVSDTPHILPTHTAAVRQRFEAVLAARGVRLHLGAAACGLDGDTLHLANGHKLVVDETVWVTQAGGGAWLRETGLALDSDGFVRVNAHLQSVSDPRVFAAGDCAAFEAQPLEKAGVFAVRQGMPLADNLRAAVRGATLRPYRPQKRWLALISTGDRFAVASRAGLPALAGAWVWRWKDHIDRRFMARFNDLAPMATPPAADTPIALAAEEQRQALSALAMRCGGCGAKVGADVLSRALADLQPLVRDDVLIGLQSPDDAAVVRVPPGHALVLSVDFFRAFIDDPWLFGRIAANHALGDLFAMGAAPQSANAIATVPPGLEAQVEDTLRQMMAGAIGVLNAAGCALVGGHSGEGRELALGFAVNGLLDDSLQGVMRKGGLLPGDALVLTKPLGTGTLLVGHAQGHARGRWVDAALAQMVQSSQAAAACLRAHGARACTDVTGFGLLGHLVEMTRASGVDAELELAALPVLDGAETLLAQGISSSLQADNLRLRRALRDPGAWVSHPRYPLLFDPQTAGGLLAGVPAAAAGACVAELRTSGYPAACVIGTVRAAGQALEPVLLR